MLKLDIDEDSCALVPGIRERVKGCRDAIERAVTGARAIVLVRCVEEKGPTGARIVVNMTIREDDREGEPEPFTLDDLNDHDQVHRQMKRAWRAFMAGGGGSRA